MAAEAISKSFFGAAGGVSNPDVLKDVDLQVLPGEFVAITGHSGCGKTTLLRILMGLEPPTSGRVLLNGTVPPDGRDLDRSMVFQQPFLLPWRTAEQNVALGLESLGLARAERRSRSQAALALVGLTDAGSRRPHHLSGGMQQRVGLARAIVVDAKVLLMDEPFGALDALTRELLQEELLRIHRVTNKTIVFITHDLDEAVLLANRVVVMAPRPGRIVDTVNVDLDKSSGRIADIIEQDRFGSIRKRLRRALTGPGTPDCA